MERSYLDCAIHISLMILELQLYKNIIEGKDVTISPEVAQQVQRGNWSSFIKKNPTALQYLGMLKELEALQDSYSRESKEYLTTQEFANNARRGLRVTSYQYLRQYEAYCKGFYLHQCGMVNEAITHYSSSLSICGKWTNNKMRLNALEAIELIISEKAELESRQMRRKLNTSFSEIGWRQCRSVYKYLSHHYILDKSVVIIVDNQFDSVIYREKAVRHLEKFYGGLSNEDYFGLISLDPKNQHEDEIMLEKCHSNKAVKLQLLESIASREMDYVFSNQQSNVSKTNRLQKALEKAYEWQNTIVPNTEVTVNG